MLDQHEEIMDEFGALPVRMQFVDELGYGVEGVSWGGVTVRGGKECARK